MPFRLAILTCSRTLPISAATLTECAKDWSEVLKTVKTLLADDHGNAADKAGEGEEEDADLVSVANTRAPSEDRQIPLGRRSLPAEMVLTIVKSLCPRVKTWMRSALLSKTYTNSDALL